MNHAKYQTPPAPLDTTSWPPRVSIEVAWEDGDAQAAITELTRAFDAIYAPLFKATMAATPRAS